jgi:lysozyme
MPSIIPANKPQKAAAEIDKIIAANPRAKGFKVILLGITDSCPMGKPGNDRRVYDDGVWLKTPSGIFCFNYNMDPNGRRPGHGFGSSKGMASLEDGCHIYKKHKHKSQYWALGQAEAMPVMRDADDRAENVFTFQGQKYYRHVGWHGINIHRAGTNTTSSLGCQTLPPSQWDAFIKLVYSQMDLYKQKTIPYICKRK